MLLPSAFCWSKFGTEAGESDSSILDRKEHERRRDGGVFLWGIGNSIRPSLLILLATDTSPVVLFTPMLSPAAERDASPSAVVSWRSARGLDGRPVRLPPNAVVTSSLNSRGHHFALVCYRTKSLLEQPAEAWIDNTRLRNLRTGAPVGASQVTAIVQVVGSVTDPARRYRVSFDARLAPPYLVVLGDPVRIGTSTGLEDKPLRGETDPSRQLSLVV